MKDEDIVQINPTRYESSLKEAVERLKSVGFGRSTRFYDEASWNLVPARPGTDWGHMLELKKGVRPSDAIRDMFAHLEKWHFDCAESVQVAHLYAQLNTVGAKAFDERVAGRPFLLNPQLSTGIEVDIVYRRNHPEAPMERIDANKRFSHLEATNKVDYLLARLPIGSRVAWTKAKPSPDGPTTVFNENAIVVGQNKRGETLYAAWGMGSQKIFTRQELESRIAGPVSDGTNVFISEIARYKTPTSK